jgi:hypothetical protein
MGIRRGDGLKVFAEAKNAVAQYGAELGRPQNQVPTPGEAGRWPTKSGTGMVQVVGLRFRENVTGRMIDRFYNIKTADGMTREDAVSRAIEETDAESGRYEQTFIGAFHASASILVPGAGF